jgi:lipoate-protein ligase A
LVLGSTQRDGVVDATRAQARGVDVARRRSGGGSVLLQPADHLWVDAWVPRDDPLWVTDIASSASWAGAWWRDALESQGVVDCEVHQRRADPGPHGALVCFAGRGPGEVFTGGRKIVGLSQWRSREGALFMMCVYTRWDPAPLVEVLDLTVAARQALAEDIAGVAAGMADVLDGAPDLRALGDTLLSSFAGWS